MFKSAFIIVLNIIFFLPNILAQTYDFSTTTPGGYTLHFELHNYDSEVILVDISQKDLKKQSKTTLISFETPLTIPDSVEYWGIMRPVTHIGRHAFELICIPSVTIPNTVRRIDSYAFHKSHIPSVIIPNSVEYIGEYAFGNSHISNLELPENIKYIGRSAFENCHNLKQISIKCTTEILSSAFDGCDHIEELFLEHDTGLNFIYSHESIKKIVYGNKAKSIETSFYKCKSLKTLVIGDHILTIPKYGFSDCDSLQTVVLGKRIVEIGYMAFRNCPNLDTIIAKPVVPPILGPNTFNLTPRNKIVITHCNSEDYPEEWGTQNFNYQTANVYSLQLDKEKTQHGSVSFIQQVNCFNTAIIEATPTNNYIFSNWSDGSTDNPRTLTLTCDTTLYANFIRSSYNVKTSANRTFMGEVHGNGIYNIGEPVTIHATPACGYRFIRWSTGNIENPLSFIPQSDTTIVAYFDISMDTIFIPDTTITPITIFDTITSTKLIYDTTHIIFPIFDTIHYTIPIHENLSNKTTDPLNLLPSSSNNPTIQNVKDNDTIHIQTVFTSNDRDSCFTHIKIYTDNGDIVTDGINKNFINIYNMEGNQLPHKQKKNKTVYHRISNSGTYIVRFGNSIMQNEILIRVGKTE